VVEVARTTMTAAAFALYALAVAGLLALVVWDVVRPLAAL
jgi:hypothetical protein